MRVAVTMSLAIFGFLAVCPAAADDNSGAHDTGFWVKEVDRDRQPGPTQLAEGSKSPPVAPILLGEGACNAADSAAGEFLNVTFCQEYAEPDAPVLTVGLIRTAFAELELPAGTLVIQPPDGLTLVNFDTNFYTTSTAPLTRTVTLLGRRVTLQATPSTFHWRFGDGKELTSQESGAPYPRLTITHNYLRKGTYRPSLSTTYSGRFRVGNGPWRDIPGTVTIDGTGQALRAIEAQPKLVGYEG